MAQPIHHNNERGDVVHDASWYARQEIPPKLIRDIGKLPLLEEHEIDHYVRGIMASTLTPRRLRALELVSTGLQAKEIAVELGIRTTGALSLLREVQRVLDARNTTHAVAIALRRGIIL